MPLSEPIEVVLSDTPSHTDGTRLVIQPRPARGATSALDWLELLLRHELAHLLIQTGWGGLGPALLWEGLPVHLGDDLVRQRILGRSYEDRCSALLRAERLIPLAELLLPSQYYARRSDPWVDLQAGALCGWLLSCGRRDELREVFETWRPPTPADPVLRWGWDLQELQLCWLQHLSSLEADEQLIERYRAHTAPPLRPPHCDSCLHRIVDGRCGGCGARPVPVRCPGPPQSPETPEKWIHRGEPPS